MRIQEAIMKLLLNQPFYGALAASVTLRESVAAGKMKMTLLPSPVLTYNREWYEGLSDAQAMGALLHELLHLLLLHSLRRGGRDPLLWTVCCDMAVNEHLPPEMLTRDAVTTEKIEQKIKYRLERQKSAERYYDDLTRLLDENFSFIQRENAVALLYGNTSLFEAEKQPEEDVSAIDGKALKSAFHELLAEARHGGELSQALCGELDEVYEQPRIDWESMFKRFLTGRGHIHSKATYKRESRRFDGFPGKKRSIGLTVLVALDESGSISDEQLKGFFNELVAVNRITNVQILVTEFDTACSPVRPAEEYRHTNKREKRGGTDFRPVFALADSLKVSFVVIFTDGEGEVPDRANQRVLWVLTKGGKQPPFGYTVAFD